MAVKATAVEGGEAAIIAAAVEGGESDAVRGKRGGSRRKKPKRITSGGDGLGLLAKGMK